MVNGQLIHFPVVFHFRHIGIGKIDGVTYLSVGAMQRRDAYFLTEIRLWRTVFPPIETTCNDIAAKHL